MNIKIEVISSKKRENFLDFILKLNFRMQFLSAPFITYIFIVFYAWNAVNHRIL